MNMGKKRFFFSIVFCTMTLALSAQQVGINSPYSRYGYGLLVNPVFGASEAMGGISYGLRRSQQVNPGNPASYSELDSLTFIFDVGVSGHLSHMKDDINKRDFYNGNLDYIAMQFPLSHKVGASIGLLPYSKVGYNFGGTRSKSNIQYLETYRGTGGLSRIYGGVAWEPIRHFSVGANFSYLFGNFSISNVATPISSFALVGETKSTFSVRKFLPDFGIQFIYPVDKNRTVTLGMVYTPQLNIHTDVIPTEMLYQADPYDNPGIQPSQILKTDTLRKASFQLPHSFGAGITYRSKAFLIGVDGTLQLWKNRAFPSLLDDLTAEERFNNSYRINAGAEYVIDPYSPNFAHRIRFRGGLSFSNSYTNISINHPETGKFVGLGSYKAYEINLGIGLPFTDYLSRRTSMLNIGFGYTRHQPNAPFMISEDRFKISINMNINELWFFKRQFD